MADFPVLKKAQAGVIAVALDLQTEAAASETLMRRYEDTPMSLADACLVRLSALHSDYQVFTRNAEFRRYCRHGWEVGYSSADARMNFAMLWIDAG